VYTYQDLLSVGQNENSRMAFVERAVNEHRQSALYRTAVDAQMYYDGENPTIMRYEKILYDMKGKAHVDMFSANHKITSSFFHIAVAQESSYLLSQGVNFSKETTKKKLGTVAMDFDERVREAADNALIGGVAFGFWNQDHIEVFPVTEFAPLYDEATGALMAGIRFYCISPEKSAQYTLFELDGYTKYLLRRESGMELYQPKRPYHLVRAESGVDAATVVAGYNYPTFPIVPLKNNKFSRSELCGRRNTIDALDLVTSNMVNNVDEGNLIYWVLTNCGGMDDLDDAKFIERLKTTHVAHADGDQGAGVEAHTIEAPFQGTQVTADMLERRLYKDFMAFDAGSVTAANQSATAINAAYTNLELKADAFEAWVSKFVRGILELAGIDDAPTFTRNRQTNKMEEMQTLLMAAPYVDDEYMTRKVLTILGDIDMADDILKRMDADSLDRLTKGEPEEGEGKPDEVSEDGETG
jgi:SPP1 family phage portal protein